MSPSAAEDSATPPSALASQHPDGTATTLQAAVCAGSARAGSPTPDGNSHTVSVIIPTLNEAPRIGDCIRSARAQGPDEIIVVDGGSVDGTREAATEADRVLTAARGRALQLNAGAKASRGSVLLFLHADCRLLPGALDAVRRSLADGRCVGGCFHQAIEARGFRYRLLEWGNAQRARWLGWTYGDQGLFVRREVFEELGGFPSVPFLEDWMFAKLLKKCGRIKLVDAKIGVSARRWERRGIVRQTLCNWMVLGLAQCGVSPHRLARFYPPVR